MLEESKELKAKLYETLLQKYKELINETEKKTVGEVKGLVNKNDLTIQSFVSKFKPENYSYESDFLETVKKCYDFIIKEIGFTKVGFDLNFWLSPEEILKNKIADDEDIAVFLCAVLNALGDETAEVLICELEDFSTHALTITEFKDKFILLDASQKTDFEEFIGKKEDVLKNYSCAGKKIKRPLYKFNSQNYEQFIWKSELIMPNRKAQPCQYDFMSYVGATTQSAI